jgi:hypothetical protein
MRETASPPVLGKEGRPVRAIVTSLAARGLRQRSAVEDLDRVRVLVPLSLPTIAVSMIMGFLGAWNGFLALIAALLRTPLSTTAVSQYDG